MQRSQRRYKHKRRSANRHGASSHDEVKRVRVTSRTQAGMLWAGSFPKDVSEETLQALDRCVDAIASMPPEQIENWRVKIKQDK